MRFVHHPAPFLAATFLIVAAACTTLRPVEPDELRGPNPPDRVRVAKTDDSTVVLHTPRLVGDTLVGFVNGARRAFALSQTTEIEMCEADPGRTAAAVVFGGSSAVLTYLVIEVGNAGPHAVAPQGNCCPPGVPCPSSVPPCM